VGDVVIREVRDWDITLLFLNMREADFEEVRAARGDVYGALVSAAKTSVQAWAAESHGQLLCLFGVAPISFIAGQGSPWLLGTNAMLRHRGRLIRQTPRYLARMLELFPHLSNFVDARNVKSIRFLKAMGFEMHAPIPYGKAGEPFIPFSMGVTHV